MLSTRLSRNTLALLVSNVGSAGLSFILSVLIGRALGTGGLGVYATALAWVFPLSLVADFGLGTLITREAATAPDAAPAYLRAAARIRLGLGGALTLLLVITAPLLSDNPEVVRGLQISAPLVAIAPSYGAFTAVFRARQVMWPVAGLNLGMLGAQVILTALVFLARGDVLAALMVNTATSAGQLLAAWWVNRRWFDATATQRRKGAKTASNSLLMSEFSAPRRFNSAALLRQAWPFALAAILAALQARISVILLERLADSGNVGSYAAASRFVEAERMIPNALFGALFPTLAVMAGDLPALSRLFTRVTLGLSAYAVLLGVGSSLLAAPMLTLTYGADFAPAAPVLQVAMWSVLPGLLRAARTLYWYALGRERFVNRVTGASLLLQIALSLWMIPAYGALGAAVVNLGVECAALALVWWPGIRRTNHV